MPDEAGELYRVVLDGTGRRSGTVASSPRSRHLAEAGANAMRGQFAADIAAGDMAVNAISETDYAARAAARQADS